jgi:hypothetical protein
VLALGVGVLLNLTHDLDGYLGLTVMLVRYSLAFYAFVTFGILSLLPELSDRHRRAKAQAGAREAEGRFATHAGHATKADH